MRTSCASDLPRHLAHRPLLLSELLDEADRPALLDVIAYDGFGDPVSQPGLLGRFAYAGLEEHSGEGLYAAAARLYDPSPGHWLESDPVGFEAGDSNLSRYVSDQRGIWINGDGTIRDA